MYTLENVWPEWKVVKEIGRGSYGVVYKCVKEEKNHKQYAAVKVISVPRDEFEMDEVVSEKMTQEQSRAYYKDIADDLLKEIEILKSLKGTKNIVEIYDAKVVEKEDGIGWNIFICMEMLTDFTSYASDKKFTQEDVIKLGIDLCSALSICHKARIIHRDIKPENIFVDDYGNFKLGDFGVAKQMAKTKGSVSVKGTYGYMSPEVFSGKKCDGRADLYSLALVMYKLLNNNRFPFIDASKQIIKYSERQHAFERRIKGESIPAIKGISDELNAVILKACSYRNVDRQKNIDEFRRQLESIGKGKKSSKKTKVFVAAATAVVVLATAATGIYFAQRGNGQDVQKPPATEATRSANEVISLGVGISEYDSGKDDYIIGSNDGQYYHIAENDEIKNLSADMPAGCKILAYDDDILYYSVNDADGNVDVYRYDRNEEKTIVEKTESESENSGKKKKTAKIPYIDNVNIDSIVYFDDEYTYYVEIYNNNNEESKRLVKYSSVKYDSTNKIASSIKSIIEYDGYIIYSKQEIKGEKYGCYDATKYDAYYDLTSSGVDGMPVYIKDNILYFAEKTEDGNITIKSFDFKNMENNSDISETTDNKENTDDNDTAVQVDKTSYVCDIDFDDSMSGTAWKINSLSDEAAIISNENAEDGDDNWYIWSYDYKELNPINDVDKLFVEGNYEFFIDKDLSKHIMVAVWEGYIFSVYEIYPSGHVKRINAMYTKEKMEGSYRIGSECFSIKDDVKESAHKFEYDYDVVTVPEETVYSYAGAGVFMAPHENSNDKSARLDNLDSRIALTKIGVIGDNWVKLKVQNDDKEEIVYMHSDGIGKVGYDKDELKKKLVKEHQLVNAEWCDFFEENGVYTFIIKGQKYAIIKEQKINEILYDVTLEGTAQLNDNLEWEIISLYGDNLPKDLEEMRKYVDKGKIDNFSCFVIFDIDHDGDYELIASKEGGKKQHGVYYLTSSDEYGPVGSTQKNTLSNKEIELYEIEDLGVLCYYEDKDRKEPDKNGVINLVVVGISNDGVFESKLVYKGLPGNIKPIKSYVIQKEEK